MTHEKQPKASSRWESYFEGRKVKTKLKKQIISELEIKYKRHPQTFLPDEYIKYRLKGLAPENIDYDMCHIWR